MATLCVAFVPNYYCWGLIPFAPLQKGVVEAGSVPVTVAPVVPGKDPTSVCEALRRVEFFKANVLDLDRDAIGAPEHGYDRIHVGAECPDGYAPDPASTTRAICHPYTTLIRAAFIESRR